MPPVADIVRRAPFPVYGLAADWTGRRGLGGGGVVMGEVTHVALRHGPGGGDEPELVVETLYGERRAPSDAPFRATLHLAADPSDDDDGPGWQPWTIPVGGRERVFWGQEAGERWAAFARVGDVRVVVAATRWHRAGVRLAVVDPADYVWSGSTTSR